MRLVSGPLSTLLFAALPCAALAGTEVHWVGASAGTAHAASQAVAPEALCQAALSALKQAAAGLPAGVQFDAQCSDAVPQVTVPAGDMALAAGPTHPLLDGLRDVAVDVRVDARLARTVRVPVRVALSARQWCARTDVPARTPVAEPLFVACSAPITRQEQLALANGPLPAGRTAHALHTGEPLLAVDVAGEGQRLRGDAVSVVFQLGAVTVESRGELRQDARLGEPTRVRLQDGQVVSGRLVAADRVQIEGQR